MTDTGASDASPRARRRWKSVLLVASLAFNLLILGLFTAMGLRHGLPPPLPSPQQLTVMSFARTLPPERKDEIWAAVKTERQSLRPYWRELRQARAGVREALTADPFDVARYRAAHDRLLEQEIKVRKAAHSLFENIATVLTRDERREFADWQEKAERRWRRSGRGDPSRHKDRDDDEPAVTNPTPASGPASSSDASPPK